MAIANLVLGQPQLVALESTPTNLRKVLVPAGTRELKYSARAEFFLQLADQDTADGAAGTAAAQFRYDPGTFGDVLPGFGLGAGQTLKEDTYVFFAGSVADQPLWLWPVTEAP